jgi:NADH-quinone oxidoreductase subunit H
MNFFLLSGIKAAVVALVLLTTLAYLQLAERKLLAHIQRRIGPYNVGWHGVWQPLADVVKLITKEDLLPPGVNKFFYVFAPFAAIALALTAIAVIPFGPEIKVFGVTTYMQLTDLNIGVLFLLALSSLSVYGVALGGWASNSKYSLIGGLRSSAQMISYELPLAMAIVSPLLMANTLSFRHIVNAQSGFYFGFLPRWYIFQMPAPQIFAFIIFLIAAFAETNRVPFDLPEAENELVAGFHTEYSSMKFAAFFMSEYCNIITICCMGTLLFLGGWHPPFPAAYGSSFIPTLLFLGAAAIALFHGLNPARPRDRRSLPLAAVVLAVVGLVFLTPIARGLLMPVFWFAAKTGVLIFVFIWVRGTLPRFRYDQLMRFAWTFLFPVSVCNLLLTGLLVALFPN